MKKRLDVNVDMGESFGIYKLGRDEDLLDYCTSANLACGFHGGDPHVMWQTVKLAKEKGIAIGAHFGLPDLIGFGRRIIHVTPEQLRDYTIYQIGALKGFANAFGIELQHVKPHGAIYQLVRDNEALSKAVIHSIQAVDPKLILFSWKHSVIYELAKKAGLRVINEFYADLGVDEDEKIVTPFNIHNVGGSVPAAIERTMKFVIKGKVVTQSGKEIEIDADTIAYHGDSPIGFELGSGLIEALKRNQVDLVRASNLC